MTAHCRCLARCPSFTGTHVLLTPPSPHQTQTVANKSGLADLVTETDQEAERVIMQILRDAFPSFSFIGEEQCSELGRIPDLGPEPTWLIDPLDGTTNFVHKYPWVCVSIGLAIARQVVVGVIYCPPLNEFYTATLGGGAFLNGTPCAAFLAAVCFSCE